MTKANTTLTHSQVNSGTAVNLGAVEIGMSAKNLVRVNPVEGRYDISEADINGFENPIITVSGIIKMTDIPTNGFTQQLLWDFFLVKSGITLTFVGGDYTTTPSVNQRLRGRPSTGYAIGTTLSNTITCFIESWDIKIVVTEEFGAVWRYNLNLVETR